MCMCMGYLILSRWLSLPPSLYNIVATSYTYIHVCSPSLPDRFFTILWRDSSPGYNYRLVMIIEISNHRNGNLLWEDQTNPIEVEIFLM